MHPRSSSDQKPVIKISQKRHFLRKKSRIEKPQKKDGIEVKPDLENSIIMFDGSLIIQKAEWPDRKRD